MVNYYRLLSFFLNKVVKIFLTAGLRAINVPLVAGLRTINAPLAAGLRTTRAPPLTSMTIKAKPAAICQMPATMHIGKMEMAHHTPKNIAAAQKFN